MGLKMKSIKSTFHKSLIVMGAVTSLSFFSIANAADYTDNPSGDLFGNAYYLGGAIGQSNASNYCDGASGCEDSDTAWKLFGGYEVIDKISVEGAYLNLGDIRKDGENSDITAFAAYGVGTLPVTERFDAFAKVGATYWDSDNTENDETGFGLAYGLGVKMTINETTKLRAEWEKILDVDTGSKETDINVLSIGFELSTF